MLHASECARKQWPLFHPQALHLRPRCRHDMEPRGIPSSLFGREDASLLKSGRLLIDPWCSVLSAMPITLCEGRLDSGRDRWFGPPMDQTQPESHKIPGNAARKLRTKHWPSFHLEIRTDRLQCRYHLTRGTPTSLFDGSFKCPLSLRSCAVQSCHQGQQSDHCSC